MKFFLFKQHSYHGIIKLKLYVHAVQDMISVRKYYILYIGCHPGADLRGFQGPMEPPARNRQGVPKCFAWWNLEPLAFPIDPPGPCWRHCVHWFYSCILGTWKGFILLIFHTKWNHSRLFQSSMDDPTLMAQTGLVWWEMLSGTHYFIKNSYTFIPFVDSVFVWFGLWTV